MTPSIALATYSGLPGLSPDCRHLLEALPRAGVTPRIIDWERDSPTGPVIIRSTWNYFHHRDAFVSWAHALPGPVFNPASVIAWNSDKRYLQDLAAQGVDVVASEYIRDATSDDVRAVMQEHSWETVVVKPTVSGAAYRTLKLERGFEDFQPYEGEVIVQPFMPEVERDGEWSVIFFEGEFSHLVLKRAKAGDFRVQDDHGGTVEFPAADPELVRAASRVLERSGLTDLAYARVDGVLSDGTFYLMELELIEPELFFRADPASADRLAEVLRRRIEVV